MNYTKSLVDQFTFILLLATLTTLIPYAYSAAAQMYLLFADRARFQGRRLAIDAGIALLALRLLRVDDRGRRVRHRVQGVHAPDARCPRVRVHEVA